MLKNILYTALHGGSIILALIGLYFVIRVWLKWKDIDMDLLKARVFLNKKFLERNWLYVFFAGASLTSHQVVGLLASIDCLEETSLIFQISETLEFASLAFLVILAYEWFKVLYRVK